ncbi:MAG: phospholipid carrier-dependent glycosyltransferase [Gammaproteobacteria bacterium]
MRCKSHDFLIVSLIIGLLFGIMLGSFPLESPDGARYAEIPREMIVSGDYLTPHLNGVKYFEKPPLFYWTQVSSIKVFGLNEWSVHIPNALFAFFTCLFVYFAGRKLFDRGTGIAASLTLATSTLFFVLARIVTLDMALTAFLTIGMSGFLIGVNSSEVGFRRNIYFWIFYVFLALAVLTKGMVGIVLPGMIIFVWMIFCGNWRDLKHFCLPSGILLFLVIVLPWHILVQLKNPEFSRFYFWEQHFLRYFTGYAQREQQFWFFPVVLIGGFLPWIFFLPQALKKHVGSIWRARKEKKIASFLVVWSVSVFVFYSFSDSKLAPYILPMFPPLALLLGGYLASLWKGEGKAAIVFWPFYIFSFIAFFLGVGFLIAIKFLDFSQYAFTPINVYLVGIAFCLSGILAALCRYKFGIRVGLIAMFFTTTCWLLALSPCLSTGNGKSLEPLTKILKTELQKTDEVAVYNNYYQDLPYYLERIITVVNFQGELEFGVKHGNASGWMINSDTFWSRWNSNKRMYMFVDAVYLSDVKSHAAPKKLRFMGSYLHTLLFANF